MGSIPPKPDSLDSEGKDFLSCCLKPDPLERSTAAELLDHPFIKVGGYVQHWYNIVHALL